jgi:hypothetical protein
MFFAEDTLNNLADEYAAISGRREALLDAYRGRVYRVARSKEFAEHGLARRVTSMTHCIENVFRIVPPERADPPAMHELTDAVVYIQAFVLNAFGCLDNLAWIWVCEKELAQDSGEPLLNTAVGLGKKCKIVRRSLPADVRAHLKFLDEWMADLENFRHALAHRIPLYIPPRVIAKKDAELYELLERKKAKAFARFDSKKFKEFKAAQEKLCRFEPVMMHSIADDSKRIAFHPRLLSDFNTICELAFKIHGALNSEPERGLTRVLGMSTFRLRKTASRLWRGVVACCKRS